ncbi:MAG: acetylglutamate kinase [Fimbriimonadaceae bacterium]|nr:acetylglutamate kinase [Fimbriimonadaceae bacterium]
MTENSTRATGLRSDAMAALRTALPYLSMYRGKTFVVKIGGEAFGSDDAIGRAVLEQIGVLTHLGMRVVVVHGAGPQATTLTEALGGESKIVDGRRVTDETALRAITLSLNGDVATKILANGRSLGLQTVAVSGVAAQTITARRRPPVSVRDGSTVDFGFVGDLAHLDLSLVQTLLDDGFLPVISPLGADANGQVLNMNADGVASALAVALGASKLIYVTGAPGILRNPQDTGSLISETDIAGLEALEKEGAISTGMLPKATSIRAALEGGVERVHVVGFATPDGVLRELFTNEGSGTLVTKGKG